MMNLGVSKYIATMDCQTAVLDHKFNNPNHTSCYEVGGCDQCVQQQQESEEADQHIKEQCILKVEAKDHNINDFEPNEVQECKKRSKRNDKWYCYGDLKTRFMKALSDLVLEEIFGALGVELAAITKVKGIVHTFNFDQAEIKWLGCQEWKTKVLDILAATQRVEDERLAELEWQKQEKGAERERCQLEREAQLKQKRLERAAQDQQRAEERVQKEAQRAREKEENDRRVAE
ncbi:hypothetical protein FRC11_007436 [Ceratobasidium sp. 423]|nr:hypothetical protein FRC11_007436 [Ceratobasidium sp. 423]